MRTTATAFILLAVCTADRLAAEEGAKDITFILTPPKEPAVYNIGERVEVDAAFSTKGHGYCFDESGVGVRDRTWRQSVDEFRVVPVDGGESVSRAVYDPYFDEWAFAPLIKTISKLSSVHRLSQRPRSVHFDLNEWMRIAAPGRYQVTARSSRVSRCSSGDPPPQRPISVHSNEIEITILPEEGNWAASELQEVLPQSIYRVLAMLLLAREFQDRPLPDENAPNDRPHAIEERGDRFNSILAELYLVRPDNK